MGIYTKSSTTRAARPRSERLRQLGGVIVSTDTSVVPPYGGNGHTHPNLADLNRISIDDGYIYLSEEVIDETTGDVTTEIVKASAGFADKAAQNADGYTLNWFIPTTVDGALTLRLNPVYAGLWADGWITAAGVNSGGGGGGGSSYLKELLDIYHDSSGILRVSGNAVSNGDILVYDSANTRWVAAANSSYTLPTASASVLGGIKVGTGLSIDANGVLSASGGTTFNGGEITTDLWLHTGSSDFGSTLYFGDKNGNTGYAYIKEDSDDHLTIYARKGITLSAGSGYSVSIPSLSVALGGLSDVTISSESTGQVLYRGSGGWMNANLDVDDIGMPSRITGSGYLYYTSGTGWSLASSGPGGSGISSVSLASGTNNGTLKLTVDGTVTDNIAVKGLAALAYKASLAFGDLSSHPTTLSGYGITDAKIQNGTITLGSNTITPLTSVTFTDLSSHPTTLSGYGITDAKIQNGTITLGSDTITPLTSFTETDPTVPSWAKAPNPPTYSLSDISGTSDLQAIEALVGTGLLKRTGTTTWTLDSTNYLSSHQTIYKLTLNAGSFTAGSFTANSAAKTFNIPTTLDHISDGSTRKLSDYVSLAGTQTITGSKTFSVAVTASGGIVAGDDIYPGTTLGVDLGLSNKRWGKLWAGDADLSGDLTMASNKHIDIGPLRIEYDSTAKALHITRASSSDTNKYGIYADGCNSAGGVAQSS